MQRMPLLTATALAAILVEPSSAQIIGVGTNPQGSLYYSVGTAVAKVVQDKAGMQARVQPSAGSSTYAPQLDRGELEFGFLNVQDLENAMKGVDNFDGRPLPNLRIVGVMFSLPIGIAVANNSAYKTIADLKGVRMPSDFPAQSTIVTIQDAVLATGGLSTADMKRLPVPNYVKGMEALGEGKVDAALMGPGSGTSQEVHVKFSSQGGLRFITLDGSAESARRMKAGFPGGYFDTLQPAGNLPGIVQPTRIMAYSAFIASGTKTADEIVYKTTKALYENKADLVKASPTLTRFDPQLMTEKHIVAYHPGAERFYREVGLWPPKER